MKTRISIDGGVWMELELYKMHGSKNTFYLLDIETLDFDYITLTKWLCDENNNGGADGLLIVLPSNVAHARMRVINADGSEASMCGNGLRCVARYICERDQLQETNIETMKAILQVKLEDDMLPNIPTYSVGISPVSFDLHSLPMTYEVKQQILNEVLPIFSETIHFSAVSVPNPHLIGMVNQYYIDQPTHQESLASFLNGENEFTPDGINVSYVYPMSNNEIFVRTFERGVGFTNACGTAMTASALIAYKYGYITEPNVTVYNPGGFVRCFIDFKNDQYQLKLIGNATYIQQCGISINNKVYTFENITDIDEAAYYEKIMYDYRLNVKERIQFS